MKRIPARSIGYGITKGTLRRVNHGLASVLRNVTEPTLLAFSDLPLPDELMIVASHPTLAGCVLPRCSPYSHLAWVAAYYDIPTLMCDAGALPESGTLVYADFDSGELLIPRSQAERDCLEGLFLERREHWATICGGPTPFIGAAHAPRIALFTQVQRATDIVPAKARGASGVGEVKGELLASGPDLDSSFSRILATVKQHTDWLPIPLRFYDLAPDKKPPANLVTFESGVLSYRGVRLVEVLGQAVVDDFFQRLSTADASDVIIVLPMVTLPSEVERFRRLIPRQGFRLGVLVETPAAAVEIDELLTLTDYLQIGINDLTQFTMASDRLVPNEERLPADHLTEPVAALVERVARSAADHGAFAALTIDLKPSKTLAAQLLRMGVAAMTVPPPWLSLWRYYIELAEAE